ncbi:MAG: hypothetical protein GXP39_12995 [Chloroflexi bacterium]|nr:hypothetical protein [Chloroflexota bacterium]
MSELLNTPIHPLIVHFPIVLLLMSIVFGVAALWPPLRRLRWAELLSLAGGVAAALLAEETGEESLEGMQAFLLRSPEAQAIAQRHATLAEAVVVVFGLLLAMRLAIGVWQVWQFLREPSPEASGREGLLEAIISRAERVPRAAVVVYFAGAAVGAILLILAGHYGGQLVYVYGIGVALAGR